MDRAGGVGIGHGYDIDEPVERGGDPGPHWTAIVGAERIAEDFKLAPVVAFDEPRDQVGTRIFTELPGYVADADPLPAAGFGGRKHGAVRRGELGRDRSGAGQFLLRRRVHREQHECAAERRLAGDRAPRTGFVVAEIRPVANLLPNVEPGGHRGGVFGIDCDGASQAFAGLVEAVLQLERDAEIEMRGG